jgi:hypothetical protein
MTRHRFRSVVWEHSPEDPATWHFITVPAEESEEIRFQAGPRRGFGAVRVEARVGTTTWRTSLFPDRDGRLVLPVKKSVRRAEGLEAGSTCEVSLEVLPPA